MRRALPLVALAVLMLASACDGNDSPPANSPSPEEAAAINGAAEILDASPDSLAAPENMAIGAESDANLAY
ncbi:hypothetical protein CLG96_11195 [Sphingomonas oleivorans]|uniref:Uncharacterized protein n=1 Tax=Sphingomonas oleivorans TaxID=1735121 RepID=A0A2T5FXU3_9SPHN|nr:hypothetical protein [Sphingomonas oleivorans]PTQ10936.1 hypothetical protein CLG96_11195 [Sphingomonas oleivorans]